jgi:hypothetical protein
MNTIRSIACDDGNQWKSWACYELIRTNYCSYDTECGYAHEIKDMVPCKVPATHYSKHCKEKHQGQGLNKLMRCLNKHPGDLVKYAKTITDPNGTKWRVFRLSRKLLGQNHVIRSYCKLQNNLNSNELKLVNAALKTLKPKSKPVASAAPSQPEPVSSAPVAPPATAAPEMVEPAPALPESQAPESSSLPNIETLRVSNEEDPGIEQLGVNPPALTPEEAGLILKSSFREELGLNSEREEKQCSIPSYPQFPRFVYSIVKDEALYREAERNHLS